MNDRNALWHLYLALGDFLRHWGSEEPFLVDQPDFFSACVPWNMMPHYAELFIFIHNSLDIETKFPLPDSNTLSCLLPGAQILVPIRKY